VYTSAYIKLMFSCN